MVFALQGNLSEFVKIRPEAKAYYELGSASLKFILPKPGFLDGIKGREVRLPYKQLSWKFVRSESFCRTLALWISHKALCYDIACILACALLLSTCIIRQAASYCTAAQLMLTLVILLCVAGSSAAHDGRRLHISGHRPAGAA